MRYDLKKGRHSVYSLYFYLIFVTKYRKKIFDQTIADRLKQLIITLSKNYEVEIEEQETDLDHIHVLFNCTPKIKLTQYIRTLKSSTAKTLRHEFPQIYRQL